MRILLNRFKESIYKDDLFKVIGYGLLNMVSFSILAGVVQFFLNAYLGIEVGLLLYLIAYMIGHNTRSKIFNTHILYQVIGEVLFIMGLFVYGVTWYSFVFHDIVIGFKYVFSWAGIINTIFPYLNFASYRGINILYNVIDLAIVIYCIISVWKFMDEKR